MVRFYLILGGLLRPSKWCALAILWLALTAGPALSQETYPAWSYYTYPPFLLEDGTGLGPDFVALLNEAAGDRFRFSLEVQPRKRIDLHLAMKVPGIVLFVSRDWMSPPETVPFTWSGPLFEDQNGVLFSGLAERNYQGPECLYGLRLGGVVGRRYKGLDEAIASGRIQRHDALNEEVNVRKLAERRIDVMTAPESILRYLVNHLDVADKVHFSSVPLFRYQRQILVGDVPDDVRDFLLEFVRTLPDNPDWHALRERYHLP